MSNDGNSDPSARDGLSPADRAAFERRASDIGNKLNAAKGRTPVTGARSAAASGDKGAALSKAMRISTELIGGIVVGGAIGYALDYWLGNQKPWLFILFFLLGAAAGIVNVVRMAAKEKTPPAPSVPDDEDEK